MSAYEFVSVNGRALRLARIRAFLTQAELAEQALCSGGLVSRLERSTGTMPTRTRRFRLEALAEACGVPAGTLIRGKKEKSNGR